MRPEQTAVLHFHACDVYDKVVKLLRMQKPPSFSATKDEICDVQNEPFLQKLFEDAIKVLRLAGAHEKDTQLGNLTVFPHLISLTIDFF